MGSRHGVFVGLMYQEYAILAGRMRGARRLRRHRDRCERRVRANQLRAGAQGAEPDGGHGVLVVAGDGAPGVSGAASGRVLLALAGGVTLMLTPATFVEFSRLAGPVAGRSLQSFSADADGDVLGRGLRHAGPEAPLGRTRGRDIRCWRVIRGTAVNQDGRSNGLTAPNGPSQQAVIREALRRSGVSPADVGYVECHGTARRSATRSRCRRSARCWPRAGRRNGRSCIGSVKTNIGHTQAAAGVGRHHQDGARRCSTV